ncbi:MAG: hypothetical protein Q8N35_07650 [Methylococcaceae bacterium]|nr:hypothetical protein [Methylococcaceae bacterium]MDP2394918.1 hypothetical protein [Methylococcaceae bacterium]MDP3019444.1 hypothetical protein [Methylococcaceae bacterium]MDP3391763.1 hypothetical protein [Methylococcaceae bacterium]MDP3933947.1 hypothetical protein [Methylococcaceae bacterium]
MNIQTKSIFLFILLTFFGDPQASIVTVNGTNVAFSYDDALLELFGAPTVAGDQLFFTPTAFTAKAIGTLGFDFKNSTINIKATALNGGTIDTVSLTERGDYISKGDSSYVEAGGQLRVTDLNAPLNEVTDAIILTAPVVKQSEFFPTRNWQASAEANVSSFGTSSVNITVENILIALSNAFTEIGFIEKKGVILSVSALPFDNITPVPLPASIWLFGTALFGVLGYSKRINFI